ncbi:MAG: AAA family ATPase [Solirubrobacteraceae bacterium]
MGSADGNLDFPGRARRVAEFAGAYRERLGSGGGGTVFVVGEDGSGRSELLGALAGELGGVTPRPVVLRGGFREGHYVAEDDDPGRGERFLRAVGRAGAEGERIARWLGAFGVPLAGLAAQILGQVALPVEQVLRLVGRDAPDAVELAPRALRRLCDDGPVVCIVDDADQAAPGGLWADLVLSLARRTAIDLPLLLILGVSGPRELGEHHDDEPEHLNVARQLTHAGIATWHPLPSVDDGELQDWTGPAAPEVLAALLEITGGLAGWTAELWRDWRARGIVDDVTGGRWRFTPRRSLHLDDVDDVLEGRLGRLFDPTDLNALSRARNVLACAALEGRRFTPAAVARALGRDADDTIDFLDENLAVEEHPDDGLVSDDGWAAVSDERGERQVAVYSFARHLDWLTGVCQAR